VQDLSPQAKQNLQHYEVLLQHKKRRRRVIGERPLLLNETGVAGGVEVVLYFV
jgi:hypothetical protein